MNRTFEPGKVIVALREDYAPSAAGEYDLRPILEGLDYRSAQVIFHSRGSGGVGDLILVELKDGTDFAVLDAVEKLSANPRVAYAEPDYREELFVATNDPLYGELWGTQRVKAPQAWEYTTGSSQVTVGVIDSGIDYRHPDIRRNMWVSPGGWRRFGASFAEDSATPLDTDGHGTHVAGTVGAVGNNRIGITGICWDVKVASLKFGLDIASAAEAIDFGNRYHFPILNASWGGTSYSRALRHAIEQYDGLFVAAAGNNGTDNDVTSIYPAAYDSPNILTVAATDPSDALARFSNYGVKTVDLAAPGTSILSLGLNGEYSTQNGTSMAAPHVAGAAALLKAYRPRLTALELKEIILASVEKKQSLSGRVATGGLLDVYAMFRLADGA